MRSVVEDFELLYVVAALCGLFAGWLLWRWRRSSLSIAEHKRLVEFEQNARSRMDAVTAQRDMATAELELQRKQSVPTEPSQPISDLSRPNELVAGEQEQAPVKQAVRDGANQEEPDQRLEQERSIWRNRISASDAQRQQIAAERDALELEKERLLAEVETHTTSSAALTAAAKEAAAQSSRDVRHRQDLEHRVAELTNELAARQDKIEHLTAELEGVQKTLRSAERAAANSQRAHEATAARNRVLEARSGPADGTS